jgi:hypothetical protein
LGALAGSSRWATDGRGASRRRHLGDDLAPEFVGHVGEGGEIEPAFGLVWVVAVEATVLEKCMNVIW